MSGQVSRKIDRWWRGPRDHRLSVAPMMDRTDRHFRFLVRRVSRRVLLYTEMVTARAVLHGVRSRLLTFHPDEHPLSLQIGGDDPAEMAECVRIAANWGYDEVNVNVGCPSDRVQKGRFGACLMKEPEQVARCVEAMRKAADLPITVKHRIGVDDLDRYEDLHHFVSVVRNAGAARFSVHARKAWLSGLSPKQNRTVPPLRYADVVALKEALPEECVEINGGVSNLEEARAHLARVDAVMIGRAVYEDPMILDRVDPELYGSAAPAAAGCRLGVAEAMLPYVEARLQEGHRLSSITRHMLNLFKGVAGAREYRRVLSTEGTTPGAGAEVLDRALDAIRRGRGPSESAVGSMNAPTASGQKASNRGLETLDQNRRRSGAVDPERQVTP
ncbi:MAG: tRNA dihydrouridine(20/20a) synthase DusA [Myxococcota bacterium]